MTTKARYAILNRIDVRAWVIALALGCVWLSADAANKGNIGKVGQTSNGRSTTIGPVTNSTGSTIPISPSMGGWTQAGNYGMPTGATGPTVGHVGFNGDFIVGGSVGGKGIKYPATGDYSIPWGTVAPVAAGIICAVSTAGVCGVAGAVAAASPYIMDWLGKAGLSRNPDTGQVGEPNIDPTWPKSDGFIWTAARTNVGSFTGYAPEDACAKLAPAVAAAFGQTLQNWTVTNLTCNIYTKRPDGSADYWAGGISKGGPSNCPAGWYVTSNGCVSKDNLPRIDLTPTQVADRLASFAPDPRVWGEILEKGGEVPMPNPTVTGPTSIQGPEKSTTNSDGSRTVERTTYNFSTAGNTITNTTNVTNNTTYNTDNTVRSSSSTTETPTAETTEKESECEKHPNTAGCADLDSPTGTIPKETKTITYAEESVFGGGSCPSDKQWSSGTMGHSYKLIDWQTFCGFALPARALVILLAIFAAFLIVMPGKEVRT